MKKRLFSAILSLCLLLTMVPTVAFAADGDDVYTAESENGDSAVMIENPYANKGIEVVGVDVNNNLVTVRVAYTNQKQMAAIRVTYSANGVETTVNAMAEQTDDEGNRQRDNANITGWNRDCTTYTVDIPESVVSFTVTDVTVTGSTMWDYDENSKVLTLDADGELPTFAIVKTTTNGKDDNRDLTESSTIFAAPWGGHRTEVEEAIVTGTATTLSNQIFKKHTALRSVKLDCGNMTVIGISAFEKCSSLTNVSIPAGTTVIGQSAFNGCASLTTFSVPQGVKTIGKGAFANCSKLADMTFNDDLETIGEQAFYGDASLTNIIIPGTVQSIGNQAFIKCNHLQQLTIENGVKSIGNAAFQECAELTEIKIPDSVTSIGNAAFIGCTKLTTFVLGSGVTSASDNAYKFAGDSSTKNQTDNISKIYVSNATQAESILTSTSAIWKDRTIIANTNGGIFKTLPNTDSALGTPEKTDCKFEGWYIDINDESIKVTDETVLEVGKVYYAKWTAKLTQDAPAAPTLKDRTYTSITLNEVANAEYSKDGGQTWQPSPEFTGLTSGTTYTFAVRYAETDDYLASPVSETADFATLRHSSGGSSSGSSTTTTNTVSASTASNGKVSLDKSTAKKGDTVTITVTPDTGYELGGLTVTDAKGNKIATTKKSDNQYTFTMPDGKVTVTPTFTKIADENPSEITYTDVADKDWYADAVAYVTNKGLMSGTGDNKFSPNASTTRGMLMTVLARYAGQDTTGSTPWYQKGMDWAKANGVSDGTNPTVNITREQLVTMLYRYAGSPAANGSLDNFSDSASVSSYAVNAMQWAVSNGIVNGSNSKLNPKNNATRAEVAAILMRYCEMGK